MPSDPFFLDTHFGRSKGFDVSVVNVSWGLMWAVAAKSLLVEKIMLVFY